MLQRVSSWEHVAIPRGVICNNHFRFSETSILKCMHRYWGSFNAQSQSIHVVHFSYCSHSTFETCFSEQTNLNIQVRFEFLPKNFHSSRSIAIASVYGFFSRLRVLLPFFPHSLVFSLLILTVTFFFFSSFIFRTSCSNGQSSSFSFKMINFAAGILIMGAQPPDEVPRSKHCKFRETELSNMLNTL